MPDPSLQGQKVDWPYLENVHIDVLQVSDQALSGPKLKLGFYVLVF
jgi:hypothetical protein